MSNTSEDDPRDLLANDLRALRVKSGLASKALATAAGWQPSKVSRIESGEQLPAADDITTWLRVTGAPSGRTHRVLALLRAAQEVRRSERLWKRRMRQGQATVQAGYNELVERARQIRHFETVYIPGLLQTPDYARRVLDEMVALQGLEVADVDEAVAVRMQRQAFLYDRSKHFEFLLAEPVIRWLLCPAEVMRAQIDRLQTVLGLPNVRFGILPMGVVLATAPQNSFQLYDDLACVETFVGETRHAGDEGAAYANALDRLWNDAAEGDRARSLLVRAANDLAE
jgi:transcriptional regulator with XRE-family HTH domain